MTADVGPKAYVRDGAYRWQTIDLDSGRPSEGSRRRRGAPELPPILERARAALVDTLDGHQTEAARVVELGIGDGYLSQAVLAKLPRAQAVLVDSPTAMMELASERLTAFADRYAYLSWHPDNGAWPEDLDGPFDVIMSFLAIHHLDNDRKRWLVDGVAERLLPGGVFAQFDLFRYPGATFDRSVPQQLHDATCSTLDEARQLLADAGLVDVTTAAQADRPTHKGEMAVVMGRKPHE